jgi:subtilase family protein
MTMRTDIESQKSTRIILKFKDFLQLPYDKDDEIQNYFSGDEKTLKRFFDKFPTMRINKLFDSLSKDEITNLVEIVGKRHELSDHTPSDHKYKPHNFFTYFALDCPYDVDAINLVKMLKENENVETAYIECGRSPSPFRILGSNPKTTAQGYLDPAPRGINARYAWTHDGGDGDGLVRFIDIEYAWNLNHEDLKSAAIQFLWGDRNETFQKDHGTSVLGILLMQDNEFGGLGISPKVNARLVSRTSPSGVDSIANAILRATSHLESGDVLLLETQVRDSNNMFVPCEVEDAIFDMIQFATSKGIIVIEAAANGDLTRGQDLDEFTNDDGKNILDPQSDDFRDSGAIMVGAASDSEDHGKTPDSNFGDRINCYAWGNNVFTADDPPNQPSNSAYTDDFSGTSSASAIIAGVAILVQSIAEASGKRRLTPGEMRRFLKKRRNGTGSPHRIGVMPDLKKIIDNVIPGLPEQ